MKADRSFAVRAVLATLIPLLIWGDCKIKEPKRCDLQQKIVVNLLSFNGTCPDSIPKIILEEYYEVVITFKPVQDAQFAVSKVEACVMGLRIPIRINNPYACDSGLKCPLKANQVYKYKTVFQLDPSYPVHFMMRPKVYWSLLDKKPSSVDEPLTIFCIELQVEVYPPDNSPPEVSQPEVSSTDIDQPEVYLPEDSPPDGADGETQPSFRIVP